MPTENRITVSEQFRADFNLVTEYFSCPPDEIEEMRECVRANFEVWEEQITRTANEIRLRDPDINVRILASIELEKLAQETNQKEAA